MIGHPFCELEFELPEGSVPGLVGFALHGRACIPEGVLLELLLSNHDACGGGTAQLEALTFLRPVYSSPHPHRLTSDGTAVRLESEAGLEVCALFTEQVKAADLAGGHHPKGGQGHGLDDVYGGLSARGYEASPAYRCLSQVQIHSQVLSGVLAIEEREGPISLASSVLEGALQLARLCPGVSGDRVASIARATISAQVFPGAMRGEARAGSDGRVDVRIVDALGDHVASLEGVSVVAEGATDNVVLGGLTAQLEHVVDAEFGRVPSMEDHLLEQGWSSLDLVRLLNRLAMLWGRVVEPAALRGEPTLSNLLRKTRPLLDEAVPCVHSYGQEAEEGAASQLSRGEQRLWYLERYAGVAPAYNQAVVLRGPHGWEAGLRERLAALVDAQPALRTCFPACHGRPQRVVAPALRLNDVLEERQVRRAQRDAVISEFARRPFDLAQGPLVRALLVRSGGPYVELVIVAHHVICDGWTLTEIVGPALVNDLRAAPLPSRSMADFTAWERNALEPERLAHEVRSGKAIIADFPTVFELPTQRPRPQLQSHRGATLRHALSQHEEEAVRGAARATRVTPFTVLFAAAATALHRASGESRFLLAMPVALRHTMDLQQTVGCLVNTLPVAVDLSGEPSFAQAVLRLDESITRTLGVPLLPLDALVAELELARDLSRNPLLQICVAYREGSHSLKAPFALEEVDTATSKFDLTIYFTQEGGRLSFALEYATDLFEAEYIASLGDQLCSILRLTQVAADEPVAGAAFTAEAEWAFLRKHCRGPAALVPTHGLPLDALLPGFALRCGTDGWSASTVDNWSRRIADELRPVLKGTRPFVGVACVRSPALVPAMIAVLRAGGAYVPIDPRGPGARALATLAAVGAGVLLHEEDCTWAQDFQGTAIALKPDCGSSQRAQPVSSVPFEALAESPLYGISTSGSTGEPKVAVVPYRGFANLLSWYTKTLDCTERDVVYVVTSPSFDLTQKNFFLALSVGCPLVLHEEEAFDPARVCAGIAREGATILNCTPSMFDAIAGHAARADYNELASLRWVVLGGEPLYAERLQPFLRSPACRARVLNSYGPSEASDVIAAYEVDPAHDVAGPVPIGHPIPNVELSVERTPGQWASAGAPGELCVSGVAVGLGYATGGCISAYDAHKPIYRTGDRVRYRPDGALLFLGRGDGQTKLRGQRFELGDVENTMARFPAVDAVAANVVDGPAGKTLALFYASDRELTPERLRGFAAERLPGVMVPSFFVRVAELPRTRTGKLDRKRLALPQAALESAEAPEAAAPQSREEEIVVDAFARVLGLSCVGRADDFFALGGHSLLAVVVADELQQLFDAPCRPSDLVRHPTPRDLARYLAGQTRAARKEMSPSVR